MTANCIHEGDGVEMYDFDAPYVGMIRVCWDCRREIVLRTGEKPYGLIPIDCGRIGYGCKRCKGTFTSTDAMSCKCPGRKKECARTKKLMHQHFEYMRLTNPRHKPKQAAGERRA